MRQIIRIQYFLVLCIVFGLLLSATSNVFGKIIKQSDIKPFVPSIMGMGGGSTAQAQGIYSLWINPAGLANRYKQHDRHDLEITSFALSAQLQPGITGVTNIINGLISIASDSSGLASALDGLQETGLRGTVSLYGGFTTPLGESEHFIGVALASSVSSYSSSLGSIFTLSSIAIGQVEVMLGYAYAFTLPTVLNSSIEARVGGSVRPLLRTHNAVNAIKLAESLSSSSNGSVDVDEIADNIDGLHGWGIGLDFGTQFEWNNAILGLNFKDVYTPLFYKKGAPVAYFTGTKQGDTPRDSYIIPFSFDIGLAYNIEIEAIKEYVTALVYVQFTDPFSNTFIDSETRTESFAKHIHMGTNISLLDPFFGLQLGLNQGYFTFGMSADIWVFDISFVTYVQEEGTRLRERPSPGMGLEIAFQW